MSNELRSALRQITSGMTTIGALVADAILARTNFSKEVLGSLNHIKSTTKSTEEMILSLTQNEQQAVNDLAATVVTLSSTTDTLATDLGAAQTAAADAKAQMQTIIDDLTAGAAVSAAQIAAMQAAADTIENDVVGALSPLTASMTDVNSRLTAIDSNLKNPSTPLTPS
jgi:hypothetical protein